MSRHGALNAGLQVVVACLRCVDEHADAGARIYIVFMAWWHKICYSPDSTAQDNSCESRLDEFVVWVECIVKGKNVKSIILEPDTGMQ